MLHVQQWKLSKRAPQKRTHWTEPLARIDFTMLHVSSEQQTLHLVRILQFTRSMDNKP